MIKTGAQDFIRTIGEEGCYALTLCKTAELYVLPMDEPGAFAVIDQGVKKGFIKPDMTVVDGAAFLEYVTGSEWTKEYKDAGYKPVKGDYLVAEWFNRRTGKTHFTLEYPVKWDGMASSVTVREGAIRSYRLYRVKE
jgi:hypothetical protein